MSDFIANIKAVLDTSKIGEQVNSIGKNATIKINKFNIDTSSLSSQIQSAINSQNYSVNLKSINTSAINSQMKTAGDSAGKIFTHAINSSLNNIKLNNGNIGNVKNMLYGAGFNKQSVASATKDLDSMIVSIDKVKTSLMKNGNIRMTISGMDEIGRAIQVIRDFDRQSGQVSNTSKIFTQTFGKSAEEIKKFEKTFNEAKTSIANNNIKSSIAQVSSSYEKLSSTGHNSLTNIKKDISSLTNLQNAMSSTNSAEILVASYNKFNEILARTKNSLSIVNSESIAASSAAAKFDASARNASIALKTDYVGSSISKMTTEYENLAATGHAKLSVIKTDMEQLKTLQNSMTIANKSGDTNTLVSNYNKFCEVLARVKNELASVSVESNSFANIINSKINSGSIGASVSEIQQKFSILNSSIKNLDSSALSGGVSTKFEKIKVDLSQIAKLQSELESGKFSGSGLVSKYNQFSETLLRLKSNIKSVTAETNQFASSIEVATLQSRMQNWLNNNTKATKQYGATMNQYINHLKMLSSQGNVAKFQLNSIANGFKQVDLAASAAGLKGKSFLTSLKGALSSITRYVGASTLIYSSISAIKGGITEVVGLDTALVDLNKTTSATKSELKDFYFSANDTAKSLGTTTKEVIQAASDWSRLGYSIKDAKTMAETSSIFKSISPDIDIEKSTDGLVSTMKAFKIEANDALDGIASKINDIGNTRAVSNGDIVDVLTRSSSAMQEANNTLEETIALGTAAVEVTRDASSVGNTLKTVSMRIRGYDEETQQYIGGVEQLSGDIADLTKTAENSSGISLFKDKDKTEFKSTCEILRDISSVYDELSDKTQAKLLEKLAGKRNGQVVAAILNNFEAVEDSIKTMESSAGGAEREMDKIKESLEYKINALKETAVGVFQNLFKSEDMGNAINLFTKILSVLDSLTEKFGLLKTTVGAVVAGFSLKNVGIFTAVNTELTGLINKVALFGKSFTNIQRDLKNGQGLMTSVFSKTVTKNDVDCISKFMYQLNSGVPTGEAWKNTMAGASVAGKQMAVQVRSGAKSLKELQAQAVGSKASLIGLKVATTALNVALSMGIVLVIQAVVTGLSNLVHAAKNASKSADEFAQKTLNDTNEVKEQIKSLDELIEKYKKYSESDLEDSSKRSEVKDIQDQIVKLVGEQADGLDLVNGKLDEQYGKLLKIKDEQYDKVVDKATTAYHAAKESQDKAIGQDSALFFDGYDYVSDDWWNNENDIIDTLKKNGFKNNVQKGGLFNSHTFITDDADENGVLLNGAVEKAKLLKDMIATIEENYSDYASSDIWNGLNDQLDKYEEYIDAVKSAAKELADAAIVSEASNDELINVDVNSLETYIEYREKLIDLVKNSPNLSEALSANDISEEDIANQVDGYLSTLNEFSDYYNDWKSSMSESEGTSTYKLPKISFEDLVSDGSAFLESVDTYAEKVTKLREALDKMKDGKLEDSEIYKLTKDFPELAGQSDNLASAISGLIKTLTGGEDEFGNFSGIYEDFNDQFGNLETEDDKAKLQDFMDTVLKLGQAVGDTKFAIDIEAETNGMQNLFSAMKQSVSSTGLTSESIKQLKNRYKQLEDYDAARLFEKTTNGIHLNTKALRELESEYEKQKKQNIDESLDNLVDEYNKLSAEINGLSGSVSNASDAAAMSDLYARRSDILDQINDTSILAAQYEGLTSDFYKWEQAQSIGEEGDMYDSLSGSLENIKKLYDDGLIGTNKFRTAVQLMSNQDLSTASIDDLISAYTTGYSVMEKYFKEGSDGCLNFLNDVQELNSEWAHMNEDGSWEINFGVGNDQEIANQLGINVEAVQSIMRKLSDFGFDINLDSIYSQLDNVTEKVGQSFNEIYDTYKSELAKLKELGYDISDTIFGNIDTNNRQILEWTDDNLNKYKDAIESWGSTIDELKGSYSTIFGGSAEYDGIEIAFSPMLQTENGAELLSASTVDNYIKSLISQLGDGWQSEDLLKLDATGIEMDGKLIKGLIADIGDTAMQTGEAMHYLGKDGSLASLLSELKEVASDSSEVFLIASQLNDMLISVGATDIKFNFDTNDIDLIIKQIGEAKDVLKGLYDTDGEIRVGYNQSDIDNASAVIEGLIYKKQSLDDAAILKVDTSKADSDLELILKKIQEFKSSYNKLEVKTAIGADTTQAENTCNSLLTEISAMNPTILAKLGVDTTNLDKFEKSINSIKPEVMVECGLDASLIEGYQDEEHKAKGKVIWDNNISKVTSWINQSHTANGVVRWHNNTENVKDKFEASGYISWKSKGNSNLQGNANVFGTAFSNGTWGAKSSGESLVGELGRELIVRGNHWFTVGEDGAEFTNIKKDDIIFNHIQTEEILKNGSINSRGKSYAQGTAFSSGSGTIYGHGSVITTPSGGGSSSSNSNSDNSSSSESEKENKLEKIDWIEIAVKRIEHAIDKLKKTADSAYKSLKSRSKSTIDEISKVREEIGLQQRAYDRYMQEANSVGLSSDLADKVKNGTIDINEYNSDTRELISSYQEWYEKAIGCSDAIDELHNSLAELYDNNFKNTEKDFENQLSSLEHLGNSYENKMNKLEAKGRFTSMNYYSDLNNLESQNINILNKEMSNLKDLFSNAMSSGEIEEYSESWFELQQSIDKVKESIDEATLSIIENQKSMRELEWSYFDYIQDRISQVNQESDFLIDLIGSSKLYDDKGQFNNKGMSTAGLHTQNYDVYMEQSNKYAQQILKINEDISKDPYNKDLIERREELLKLQQDSISSAENEKKAIKDLVSDGIDLELSSLKKLIDTYTHSLDSAKNLYEYNKKVKEQTVDISKLQKQLSAYEGDTSEENKSRIQKIKIDLGKAQENLAETEYDHFVSETKDILDDLYTEYEKILNKRLDDVNALMSDMIDTVNSNSNIINQTLESETENVGYTMTDSIKNIWANGGEANTIVSMYGDDFEKQLIAVNQALNNIQSYVVKMISDDSPNTKIDTNSTTTVQNTLPNQSVSNSAINPAQNAVAEPPKIEKEVSVGGKINAENAKIYTTSHGDGGCEQYFKNDPIYVVLGEQNGYLKVRYHQLSSGVTGWFKKGDIKAYKTGGFVNYTGLAQLDGTPSKPEIVLNPEDTNNFIKLRDILRNMSQNTLSTGYQNYSGFSSATLSGLTDISKVLSKIDNKQNSINNSIGEINITIPIEHIDDYNDFVNQLKKDKKFENLVRSMTINQLAGGSSLEKNKYNW